MANNTHPEVLSSELLTFSQMRGGAPNEQLQPYNHVPGAYISAASACAVTSEDGSIAIGVGCVNAVSDLILVLITAYTNPRMTPEFFGGLLEAFRAMYTREADRPVNGYLALRRFHDRNTPSGQQAYDPRVYRPVGDKCYHIRVTGFTNPGSTQAVDEYHDKYRPGKP